MRIEPDNRSWRVLAALVREYISSGEPVPSSWLASAGGVGVSSATIRNILARLEDEGYLQQPHTSAGRIPTDRAYRFFVDRLLETRRPARTANAIEARLREDVPDTLVDSVLPRVSHVLSQTSRSVGFAVRPARAAATFDRIDFIPLSSTRVLVIIVARGGHVLQKAIDVGEPLRADDLHRAANYLNEEFSGLPLFRAREAVLERLQEERLLCDHLLTRAMELARATFVDLPDERTLYVEGAASLLEETHGVTVRVLQELLTMMEEKQRLLKLLNEYIDGPGLTVVIGAEHPNPSLRSFSLIASTYEDGAGIGALGVIGPTRMRYSRAIAAVDGAARAISRMLRVPN
jgi:heat-inducible transcriptional repressor